jgi:integrase
MCLHRALETGVKWGLLALNPADSVDPPKDKRSEMRTMTIDDIHRFIDEARKTPYYVLFVTAIYTGMRGSELLALRWSDIDLLGMQISITRSIHQLYDRSFVIRQPKTAKGRRVIAIPPSAALALGEYREKRKAQKKLLLKETIKEKDLENKLYDDLVFSEVDSKPMLPDSVSHAWVKLANKLGLKGIHLHSARHSFAAVMLKQNIHPAIVQQMLGHASSKQLLILIAISCQGSNKRRLKHLMKD